MINLNEVGIATGTGTIAGHTRALYVGSDIKGIIPVSFGTNTEIIRLCGRGVDYRQTLLAGGQRS
jgi:hypothetical protein